MFEIIPNWHPVFVHFTVALFALAVGLFVITPWIKSPLQEQWLIVARWALWFGAAFTLITGLTGLYAYNTVSHDTPSHAAMTDHRNWALATIGLFLILAIWSMLWIRRNKSLGVLFIAGMVLAGGVLASTAWRGGEAVYRYGLGVMSLPKVEGEGHAHEHAGAAGRDHATSHGQNSEIPHVEGAVVTGKHIKAHSETEAAQQVHHDDGHDH